MEFIDLMAQQDLVRVTLEKRIAAVMAHGKYIMGPEVKELEDKLAAYVGVEHAVGCASGTDALLIALMAMGVGPGAAVFTTPFTFIATAEVISLLGATPVFVDIDETTFNMDVSQLEKAVKAVSQTNGVIHPLPSMCKERVLKPSGIIAVDLFGLPADYDAIDRVAKKFGLFAIEDSAQSFGAELRGRKACSFGDVACTSFFPAKPLGCYGDGGMCFTNNKDVAEILKSLRVHGAGNHKYDNIRIGVNGRLDTLQAAILLAKLSVFPDEVERRQEVAKRYEKLFGASDCRVISPRTPEGYKSVWAQYSILAERAEARSVAQETLNKAGIPTAIYYPRPLHLQTAFADLGYKPGSFPVSESCANRIFSLPMHPYLKEEDQKKIVRCIEGLQRGIEPKG
jgi:dTDP-4-amino-4,6-dideoxygalactose transaminase